MKRLADQFDAGEEEGDLFGGGFRGIGAVHGVFPHGESEFLADGAFGGVGRVGGAHDFAVFCDGVFTFEDLHHDRLGDHVFAKLIIERTLLVHGVERLSLSQRQLNALGRHDAQAGLFELGDDLAGQVALGGVGFDDGEGTLDRHGKSLLDLDLQWKQARIFATPEDCAPDNTGKAV
ncbi:hypothetical protein C8N42_102155 [Celeribacter persicus]|uniref:Uncharacterized protein n=1 Tax=Celeribacter persicus TaxID=1651082 RepID=A0A2T5HUJ6_9RHOB|nr:hypothetical protein C8N42_102155 [Celeribacter persicus]